MGDQMHGAVVVGVDGSPNANAAVAWAAELASRMGVAVSAVAVLVDPPASEPIDPTVWKQVYAIEVIQKAMEDAGMHDVPLSVVEGSPASTLRKAASGPDVSMLVVGARGLGALRGLLVGSISRRLLFSVDRPIVLIPKRAVPFSPSPTILVGIDGSPVGDRVVGWAASICQAVGARATMLRCSEPGAERPVGYVEEYNQRVLDRLEEQAEAFRNAGVAYSIEVSNNDPRAAVLDVAARSNAELIVIGKHGAGLFQGLGGTASYLAQNAEVPLAMIP